MSLCRDVWYLHQTIPVFCWPAVCYILKDHLILSPHFFSEIYEPLVSTSIAKPCRQCSLEGRQFLSSFQRFPLSSGQLSSTQSLFCPVQCSCHLSIFWCGRVGRSNKISRHAEQACGLLIRDQKAALFLLLLLSYLFANWSASVDATELQKCCKRSCLKNIMDT